MNIKFSVLQKNTIVGDLRNNFILFKNSFLKANKNNCDFFITPELALTGYPPKDFLHRDDFHELLNIYKEKIIELTKGKKTIFVLGLPIRRKKKLYNSVLIIKKGKILKQFNKYILPNYGVFDEKRYFSSTKIKNDFFLYKKLKFKFLVCEDLWNNDFIKKISSFKYDFIIVLNASPFEKEKFSERLKLVKSRIEKFKVPILYVNLIGGQDDLVFDGGSFCVDKNKIVVYQGPFFRESDNFFSIDPLKTTKRELVKKVKNEDIFENIYNALVLALRDYLKKNNFSKTMIGISGGIDSALCSLIACDAIGSKNVSGFFLPTKYSSLDSKNDSIELAKNLGFELDIIPIEKFRLSFDNLLSKKFGNLPVDQTEENLQSRIRGNILMALSNKFNMLLLATGNKSELSVGYSTIYGDMCGGFSLLKDVYKSEVYKLCSWRNKNYSILSNLKKKSLISEKIIQKEPSAELKDNQKDSDSLPPYEILDKILFLLIDKNFSIKKIEEMGFDRKMIIDIWRLIIISQHKRFQSAIGPKISKMSFDYDRRFPITNKFEIERI